MSPSATRITRRLAAGVIVAVTCLSAACVRARTDPVTGKLAVDVHSPLQKGTVWNAKMSGEGPAANAVGQARAEVYDGQTTVTVSLQGLTAGGSHPWRVYQGRCSEAGGPLGEAELYTPLAVGDNGLAQGAAKLPLELGITRKYKVRVFASPQDPNTVVACGDLSYD